MATYKDNQKSQYVQRTDAPLKKITGLWVKTGTKPSGKKHTFYRSGFINLEGWKNLQAYGENTILVVLKNFTRTKGGPEYVLCAMNGVRKEDLPVDESGKPIIPPKPAREYIRRGSKWRP